MGYAIECRERRICEEDDYAPCYWRTHPAGGFDACPWVRLATRAPKLRERLFDRPGVLQNEDMVFMNLFPHKSEIAGIPYEVVFAPFGRTFVRWQDFDPQPEPPGLVMKLN